MHVHLLPVRFASLELALPHVLTPLHILESRSAADCLQMSLPLRPAAPSIRQQSLGLYRRLLRATAAMPISHRGAALLETREAFVKNRSLEDPEKIAEAHRKAESRIKFLDIVTPHPVAAG